MDGGVYIAVFHLPRARRIAVGRLGRFDFAPGLYFYVGSGQRGLQSRLARHDRKHKPLRWHIDHLSRRARMLGAILIDAPQRVECETAAMLGRFLSRPVAGFGASDCRCGGHLFHAADWP